MWRLLTEAHKVGWLGLFRLLWRGILALFRLIWRGILRCLVYLVVDSGNSIVCLVPVTLPVAMVMWVADPVAEEDEERLHGTPPGHPELLAPDVPLTPEEVALWSQLQSLDTRRTDPGP